MALKDILITTGFLTFATVASFNVNWEDKVYNPNKEYYVGDNKTVINQQSLYSGNSSLTEGYAGVPSAGDIQYASPQTDSNSVTSDSTATQGEWGNGSVSTLFALDNGKSWKETLEAHYASGNSFEDLSKDKAPVFKFDKTSSGKVFWPFNADGYITSQAPSEACGDIDNFESYFSKGNGAYIDIQTSSDIDGSYYTIRYSYISKAYMNDGQDYSKSYHKVGQDDKALYYTNYSSTDPDPDLLPQKSLVAFAGVTGGFQEASSSTPASTEQTAEDSTGGEEQKSEVETTSSTSSSNSNYVKIEIFKSSTKGDKGTAIEFKELYNFS